MLFPRKENRPERPAYEESPRGPHKAAHEPWGRRVFQAGFRTGSPEGGRGGVKAPFISRASARTLLIIPLLTLLIISFHPLSSPVQAAGEVAPSFRWPARGEVTRPFSASGGPYGAGGHAGIDIALASGSDVRASAPGTVSFAGRTPVGPCVSVIHCGGFRTTYVSLGSLAVRRGQEVQAGQFLGSSDGSKDRSSSLPHLHFGMFLNGVAVDPLPFLQGRFLDPGECLFLGPWEDQEAIDAYVSHHGEKGFFDWLGGGLRWLGRTLGDGFEAAGSTAGRALKAAWGWVSSAGRAAGRAFTALYREYIAPWLVPLCRGALEVAKAVISNRFVQAILAGLAAALVVCLAVVGIAFIFGLSLLTTVIAAVVGSIAAIGYSIYYALTAGDSFSFAGCFLASLSVGGAAAATCLLISYLAPVIGAGWSSLGWLGFGKAFLVHACADSIVYIAFCLATGRKVSPMGVLASFLIGGLTGGAGKLVTAGLSHGAAQALAAGWLSSGGALITRGGAASISTYALAATVRFTHKAAYALFCGCAGLLGDVIVRAACGGRPSITESLLCFGGGALVGVLNLAGRGEGLVGLISRMSGGRLRISSDMVKALVGRSLSKGLKEGSSYLLRWLGRRGRRSRESLWQPKIGGEI